MNKKTILLVEDNPDDVKLTLRAFKRLNLANAIDVAHDGAEALDYVFGTGVHAGRDTRLQPTLILLDLKLPRISGLEFLQRLRENPATRLLPVVILTSSQEEQDRMAGYALGANSYVRKPVDYGEFIEAVGQLGLYWLLLNQSPPPSGGAP